MSHSSYFKNNEITIEVTNNCSASCVMCPRELMTKPIERMTDEVWRKTVDDAFAHDIKVLDLCGYGDVFLDKDLFRKLDYAKSLNPEFHVYVSTTGAAMFPRKFEQTLEYIDTLKFSIYGTTKDVYEKMMEGCDFDKSMSNILDFLNFQAGSSSATWMIANYIVMEENAHQLQDWIDMWEPKMDEVYAWKPHNWVTARDYRDMSGKTQSSCGRPLDGPLNIASNGDAHVCCYDFNKVLTVGNIREQSIDEILSGEAMKFIQEKHRNNDFDGLICADCDQTTKDDSVLIYKSNPDRVVGMSNSSMYVYDTPVSTDSRVELRL
ncbi:MAG: SPASM domain-containing protein [Acidimicrobiales bacterium]|nr:SPASM domain-containing protein [Acidimicrobiales bacterium]